MRQRALNRKNSGRIEPSHYVIDLMDTLELRYIKEISSFKASTTHKFWFHPLYLCYWHNMYDRKFSPVNIFAILLQLHHEWWVYQKPLTEWTDQNYSRSTRNFIFNLRMQHFQSIMKKLNWFQRLILGENREFRGKCKQNSFLIEKQIRAVS